MTSEVAIKEGSTVSSAPAAPAPMSLAEKLMGKKAFTLTQPAAEKATVSDKSDTATVASSKDTSNTQNTRALAGLMMVKRRVGKWKSSNIRTGSTVSGSVRSGVARMALENTYQIEPTASEKFDVTKVKQAIEDSFRLYLVKQSAYNQAKCKQITKLISDDVKGRVKKLGFKRYKYVVSVVVGQTKEQGLEYASRCVWNTDTDNVATVIRQHKDMYVVVNVYGIYFE